jgi:mannose-6-phosphate isomerase-like protein (cupin superfamily)
MNNIRSFVLAAGTFAAGIAVAHLAGPATAEPAPLVPLKINVAELGTADLNAPPAGGTIYGKTFVATDGATVGVQIGATPKHYHADANEIQYVVAGTGSEFFVDKRVDLKPGDLLVIPKGTLHGGLTDGVKLVAIKTPPQAPTDTHVVP